MAEAQVVAYLALSNAVDDEELIAFIAAQTKQQEALQAFAQLADADQVALVNAGFTGDAVMAAEGAATDFILSVGQEQPAIDAATADRVFGAVINYVVLRVVRQLHADLVAFATDPRDNGFPSWC